MNPNPLNVYESQLNYWDTARGLLWFEWLKQRKVHLYFFVFVTLGYLLNRNLGFSLYGKSVYPLISLILILFGYIAGSIAGKSGGSEEYYLSLPPLRPQIFMIRFLTGFIPFCLITWTCLVLYDAIDAFPINGLLAESYFCFFFAFNIVRKSIHSNRFLILIIFILPIGVSVILAHMAMSIRDFPFLYRYLLVMTILNIVPIIIGYLLFMRKEIS